MHPEYPNDNIGSLLRPGDSLVRRWFEFLASWDWSLFYQPRIPSGGYAKLPCSQCVKHIVRQWLFVNSVVVLRGSEILWVYTAALQSQQNKGLFRHWRLSAGIAFICGTGGARSSETPPFHDPNWFITAMPKEQVNPTVTPAASERLSLSAGSLQTGPQLLGEDEGQKVGLLPCFLTLSGSFCDANPDASSDNGSLAFQENCSVHLQVCSFDCYGGLRNLYCSGGQMHNLNAKVEC